MLRAQVQSVAQSLQVPPDLPLMLGLGTLSATVAGRVEVEVRSGWTEPVGIYTACILPPASRKSPAYAAMTEPLRRWEAESVRLATPRVLAAQDVVEVAEKKLERVKGDAAKNRAAPDEVEDARHKLEDARARVPADGRILAGDITPEAMVLRMAAQGGRLAILEPEPGPLQLLAGRYSHAARLDELKKAWSTEAITVDRVGRAPVRVARPALTLALCLQPGVLEGLENGGAFRSEGVLGRILWCRPPHGLGSRHTGENVPPLDKVAEVAFSRIVRTLAGLQSAGLDDDGTEHWHVLCLSSEALDVLHTYEAAVELELADEGRCASIRDWAGKCVGQSVRVAALLELAGRAEDGRPLVGEPISAWAMGSAVQLMRALTTHALAVLAPTDKRTALLWYILQRAKGMPAGSTLRDLYERVKGRVAIESMEDLRQLMDELKERGCLRLRPRLSTRGRPPSPVVEVHPSLSESIRDSRTSTRNDGSELPCATSANSSRGSAEKADDPLVALQEAPT